MVAACGGEDDGGISTYDEDLIDPPEEDADHQTIPLYIGAVYLRTLPRTTSGLEGYHYHLRLRLQMRRPYAR